MTHGIKPGVNVAGLRPEMVLAAMLALPIFQRHNTDLIVTSALDGKHSRGSLHYVGLAIDLRTRDLPPGDWMIVREELALALGAQFDVVLEKDHIHVEFDVKEPVYG